MKFHKIGFGTPLNETIMLYWKNLNHVEDGDLYVDDYGNLCHYLFDGESLSTEPSHWNYMPEVED